MEIIYLDHHATTPVAPSVLEAMWPYFAQQPGNAASTTHRAGAIASTAVDEARAQVAALIGAPPLSMVFTSGATESINLALKGLAEQYPTRRHFVTAVSEHPATLDTCALLEDRGFRITRLSPGRDGHIDPALVEEALADDTLCVSLMMANNEVGTLLDTEAIGEITRRHKVFFHCDAAQSAGKVPIDVDRMQIDLLSLSAHKFYGPKGIGALYLRRKDPRVRLVPQIHGGGHERGLRSGTLAVPLVVGLGEACRLAVEEMATREQRIGALRDLLLAELAPLAPVVNGDLVRRLAGNLNLQFPGVWASDLLPALPALALSTSSACSSARSAPSRTLRALGLDADQAAQTVRFGLGRDTTETQIKDAARMIREAVLRLRREAPEAAVCNL